VLILGATGTGKELVARGVHAGSRRGGELIAVNCAALPANLVEATLFGHRRGSFTGAVEDRPGFVASAHRGTLFLDEIADLPRPAQGALLRFLQEGEVMPIGETHAATYDVRVIAATHRDLPALARQGSFREDLLARLQGLTVRLPPLCERREDLGLLIASLLGRLAPAATFTPAAARALLSYSWPQNVRELELALSAASILAGGGAIDLPHVPATVRQVAAERAPAPPARAAVELSAEDAELREAFLAQLREHRGNVAAVARAMGKGRMQIHRWLKRFGVDLDAYRR
jgi:DNA-binding NtrC family response regulator